MTIRPARAVEAWGIAALHAEIAGGFLPTLGTAFLTRLYKALIAWPAADVLVAEQDGSPAGFVASVEDAGAFYKHFAARHGVLAGLAALPRLVRPSVMKRAIETFRYGTGDDAIDDDAPVIRASRDGRSDHWRWRSPTRRPARGRRPHHERPGGVGEHRRRTLRGSPNPHRPRSHGSDG